MPNKTKRLLIISLLFSFILITLYFISKRTYVMDESFSFALSNYFEGPISGWIVYDSNTEIPKQIMNGYTVIDKAFNYKSVYGNLAYDVHPPLYHYLLHTISSIFKGRFTIWFSYLLNAPLFLINCLLLMKIVKEETKSDLLMILINLIYCLNATFLFYFQLIRMYQMLSTVTLLFLYIALKVIRNKGKAYLNYLFLLILTIIGGLTHYYFYVALGSISLAMAIYLIINKRYKDLMFSFIACTSGFLLNIFVFFKATINQFTFSHGASSLDKLKHFVFNINFMKSYIEKSYGGTIIFILSIIIFIISIIMLIKKHKEFEIITMLLTSYFIYYLFISNLATYADERYMMAVEAIGLLALFLGISYLLKDKRIISCFMIGLIILNCNFSWISKLGSIKSWDIARYHQWDKALVVTSEENNNYNFINAYLWNDLRWYKNTYTTSDKTTITDEVMGDEFVLYIEKTLNQNKIINKIKNELVSGQDYKSIEKIDVEIANFNMYILHG